MSNEVAFNSLEKDDVKITFDDSSGALLKPTEQEIAAHRKTRLILVVLFGIVVLALVVAAVVIIAVSPQCEPKTTPSPGGSENNNGTVKANETADDSWWKHAVFYQVYPRSFFDKSGDGNGDLQGISSKLDYLNDLGVNALLLNPIYDAQDYTRIDTNFGSMEDFDNLLKGAKQKGLKIIMDFVPNHTSEKHPWFVESKGSKNSPKRDWYIWRDGKGQNKTDPPNNWLSVSGGSAWEYDNTTKQFYLHQFKKQQPDLNLRNQVVKDELKKALKFWLDKGVDGFRFDSVQYFVEDEKFEDEPEKVGYNVSDPMYDLLDHKSTFDLDQDLEILQEFLDLLKSNGSNPLVIAEVHGDYNKTSRYFEKVQMPENLGLISKVKRTGMTLSQGIHQTIIEYLSAVPEGKTPNWVIGSPDEVRVGSRDNVGNHNRNAMNALLLTLPGLAMSYYGEEIGILNGDISDPADPSDNQRTPMQWDDSANAGFTTSSKPWLPVTSDYKTDNVKTEKTVPTSFYNNYIKLVNLRKKPAFASDDFKIVHKKDKDVLSYTRGSDTDQYQVAINFGDAMWHGDFEHLSGRGVVVFDSESNKLNYQVDVNKIKLIPGQVLIVSRGNETWHEN